ncbi:hypothetical protein MTAT_05020 [Moorella thermoacetica]|uniref:Uncharacterized protein n=1 Tax=Neomoorella thermoacetica TaxID=1525 RepID=A0A1D7XAE3_NEOTH|nr:hypothetical protein Maut_01424 [Moorella thermoacetica]OIQ09386.1 hypothetical protein MOOR_11500 [Moorella thermoacetica]TYL14273.1 hypothetical protein MTAT_05020 [Moorella thermoacetica]
MHTCNHKKKQALWPDGFTPPGSPRFRLIFGLGLLAGGLLYWLFIIYGH